MLYKKFPHQNLLPCFSSFPRRRAEPSRAEPSRAEPLLYKRTSLFLGWPVWTTKFPFKWYPRFSTVLIHLRSRNFREPTTVNAKSTAWRSQRNLIAVFWFKWNTTLTLIMQRRSKLNITQWDCVPFEDTQRSNGLSCLLLFMKYTAPYSLKSFQSETKDLTSVEGYYSWFKR